MSQLTSSCRVRVNAAGDWQVLPPAGQITQIGDAGATSRGLVNNDDLFVSAKFEVGGTASFNVSSYVYGRIVQQAARGASCSLRAVSELLVIPVGQGAAGVNTLGDLALENSIVFAAAAIIVQAPGGGATIWNIGRTGGNIDEFAQNMPVALSTQSISTTDGDGANTGPVFNAADNTLVVTTDANVLVSDMQIRITTWAWQFVAPTS